MKIPNLGQYRFVQMCHNHQCNRESTDPLVLSTLPHYICILIIHGVDDDLSISSCFYSSVVLISSTLSLMWHLYREPISLIYWLDYGFAVMWVAVEMLMALAETSISIVLTILLLNIFVAFTNQISDYLAVFRVITYTYGHSIWHLLSSCKCIFVAIILVTCKTTQLNTTI